LNGFRNHAATELFRQRRERLRSTGVFDCDFDFFRAKARASAVPMSPDQ